MRCVQCLLFILIAVAYPCVYIQTSQVKRMRLPGVPRPLHQPPAPPTQINHHTLHTQSVKQPLLYVKEPRVEVCVTLSEGFHPLTSFGSDGKAASVRLCVHAPVFIFSSPCCNTAIPPNSLQQVMFTLRFFQMLLPAPTAASGSPASGPLSRSPHADHCRCHSRSRLSLAFCVWELLIYSSFLCRQAHCI